MPAFFMNILYPLISVLPLPFIINNLTFFIKPNKKYLFIYTSLLYIVIAISYMFNIKHASVLTLFVCIFIYWFIIYKKFYISIALSVFVNGFVISCDSITGFLFIYLFNYDYSDITNNYLIQLEISIVFFLLSYFISKIFRIIILKIFRGIHSDSTPTFNDLFLISIVILIILFLIYVYFLQEYIKTFDKYMVSIYILSAFIFLISTLILIYYGFATFINNYKLQEFNRLRDYTTMIENMYTDLRSFKHDYLNILSTIETYIQNQDLSGLRNYYYKDLLPDSNELLKKDISLSTLSLIKIIPLKALLSSKFISAHSKGICIKIEISDIIDNINVSTIDICRIIGILIDNAIEGSILCENKFIHFAIIKTDNSIIFNIINSCLSSTPPVYRIYKKGFSTKGTNRGIGLNSIRNLIDNNYNNILLNTTIENCLFKQELIITMHNR